MSDDRLRVFVSSKMVELKPERQAVAMALAGLNVKAWVFERDAGARSQTIEQTFLDEVERADLYVAIFWKGHGDYTIEEFEHARALGTDCFIYEKHGPEVERERSPQLAAFLARINDVSSGFTSARFESAAELAERVRDDVTRWKTEIIRQRLGAQAKIFVGVPQSPPDLVGRSAIVKELVHRLQTPQTAIAIEGMPGVGKTALAAYLVKLPSVLRMFEDGVLWAGLGPDGEAKNALVLWARELGLDLNKVSDEQLGSEVANSIGLRRMLLVIDDAWDSRPAAALKCGGPNCSYLLTTRDGNVSREFARAAGGVTIGVLTDSESYQLLQVLAPEACAADSESARSLAIATGGLPQVLTLLGGYLAAPDNSLFADLSSEAMHEMSDPRRRLQLAAERLGSGGRTMTLEQMIAMSLDRLPPTAVDAFYGLGAFVPKPEWFAREAAEFIVEKSAGEQPARVQPARVLAQLGARHLIEVNESGTMITMHQTLSDVARSKLPEPAISSHQEYYLGIINRDRHARWVIADHYAQIRRAWQSLPEEPVLIEWLTAIEPYHFAAHLDAEQSSWMERALAMASDLGLRREESLLRANIAVLRHRMGRIEDALSDGKQALALCDEQHDRRWTGRMLRNLGFFHLASGNREEALDHLLRSVPILKENDDPLALATTFRALAAAHRASGEELKATLFDAQARLTDVSGSNPRFGGNDIDLAFDSEFQQLFSEPPALVVLDSLVGRDQGNPGFDGTILVAVRRDGRAEWRCWHAEFASDSPPRTRFSGVPEPADCVLFLTERAADGLVRGTMTGEGVELLSGDRTLLEKLSQRYLKSEPIDTPQSPRERGDMFHLVGAGLLQEGQPQLALENLTIAVACRDEVVRSPDASREDSFRLTDSLRKRAEALAEVEKREDALTDLERAIAIEAPLASSGEPAALEKLASSLSHRAQVMASSNRLDDAVEGWQSALAVRQRAPDFASNDDLVAAQASDHVRRALFLTMKAGGSADAAHEFEQGIELYSTLVRKGRDRFKASLATSLRHGAETFRTTGRHAKALDAYDQAIELREQLSNRDVAAVYKGKAFCHVTLGNPLEALSHLNRAVEMCAAMHETDSTIEDELADSLFWRAYAHAATDASAKAVADATAAVELYRSMAGRKATAAVYRDLIKSLRLRAELLGGLGRQEEVIRDVSEALSAHERTEKFDDPDSLKAGAEMLTQRAGLLESQGRYEESASDLRRALHIYEALAAGTSDAKWNEPLALTQNSLAWLLATCQDEALRDGAAAVVLAERACDLTQWSSYPYFDTLAAAYAESGDFDRARQWQTRAAAAATDDEKPGYQERLSLYEQGRPFRQLPEGAASA